MHCFHAKIFRDPVSVKNDQKALQDRAQLNNLTFPNAMFNVLFVIIKHYYIIGRLLSCGYFWEEAPTVSSEHCWCLASCSGQICFSFFAIRSHLINDFPSTCWLKHTITIQNFDNLLFNYSQAQPAVLNRQTEKICGFTSVFQSYIIRWGDFYDVHNYQSDQN